MERIKVALPVIVEGKYDKIAVDSVIEGRVFTTDGFGLFAKEEKTALFRRLAERGGVIVLTDSDGGGKQIRSYLSGILPKEKVYHLYIPQIAGKEKRKKTPGKAGVLGVEGMEASLLRELFAPFAGDGVPPSGGITKQDLYFGGLSGREGSEAKRSAFATHLGLPGDMTANALLAALNVLYTREEFEKKLAEAFPAEGK